MNLVVNARHAMPRGGRLTIETSNVDMTNSYHSEDAALALGRYAMLAVSDTRYGLDAGRKPTSSSLLHDKKKKVKDLALDCLPCMESSTKRRLHQRL